MIITPDMLAADLADCFEDSDAARNMVISQVFENEFYVDVHNPGEGNQRFTVTVTESTDIRT